MFQGVIGMIAHVALYVGAFVGPPLDPWRDYALVTATLTALLLATCVLVLRRRPSVPRNGTSVRPSS